MGDVGPDAAYKYVSSAELDAAAQELVRFGRLRVSLITTTEAPSIRIDGPCPRCTHEYAQTQALRLLTSTVRGSTAATQPAVSAPVPFADFLCDCDGEHRGAPPHTTGCGASYTVSAED